MIPAVNRIEDLEKEDLARLILDFGHRIVIHYALWFTEVRHQMGMEQALTALGNASQRSLGIQLQRLGKLLGFDMQNGIPAPLLQMSHEDLVALADQEALFAQFVGAHH